MLEEAVDPTDGETEEAMSKESDVCDEQKEAVDVSAAKRVWLGGCVV